MLKDKTIDQKAWEKFVASKPEANFLDSWAWGELHSSMGVKVVRRGFYRDDKLIGVVLGIVKNARRGRYIEVPGGPLIDWSDTALARACVQYLRDTAHRYEAVFVRLRPQVIDSIEARKELVSLGLHKAPMHLHAEHTSVIDLTQNEDDLLKNMRRQTRYEVRKSIKLSLEINARRPDEVVDQFITIQHATAERQKFIASSPAFLRHMAQSLRDLSTIYVVSQNKQPLNLGWVIHYGSESDYFEAASTEAAYRLPGAYGLIWRAMNDAKKRGNTRLNLWGIAYNENPKNRYAGVTLFKHGFGGKNVTFVPAHDLIIKPLRYSLDWTIETARRKRRKL